MEELPQRDIIQMFFFRFDKGSNKGSRAISNRPNCEFKCLRRNVSFACPFPIKIGEEQFSNKWQMGQKCIQRVKELTGCNKSNELENSNYRKPPSRKILTATSLCTGKCVSRLSNNVPTILLSRQNFSYLELYRDDTTFNAIQVDNSMLKNVHSV